MSLLYCTSLYIESGYENRSNLELGQGGLFLSSFFELKVIYAKHLHSQSFWPYMEVVGQDTKPLFTMNQEKRFE